VSHGVFGRAAAIEVEADIEESEDDGYLVTLSAEYVLIH
jgi:hypothetical protein